MLRDGGKGRIDLENVHFVFNGIRYPLHKICLVNGTYFTMDPDLQRVFLIQPDGTLVDMGDMQLTD